MDEPVHTPLEIPPLPPEQLRVLGCLVEKSYTTPDYYPMTVNALVNACNQKSSREPVVAYGEDTIHDALDALRESGWAILVRTAGARTLKYKHNIRQHFQFTDKELALLTVLILRGPQTLGELRSRTERIAQFEDLADVEQTMRELVSGYPIPLAKELPRQAGRKDHRYMHLLGGDIEPPEDPRGASPASTASPGPAREDRLHALEQRIDHLEQQVHRLQEQVNTLNRLLE